MANVQLLESSSATYQNKHLFMISLIMLQLVMIPLFYFFISMKPHQQEQNVVKYYPSFADLNVMMVFGFGLINTYIRTHCYFGMMHNFLFNCVSYQLFFLFTAFFKFLILDPSNPLAQFPIRIQEQQFTLASYSVTAMNVSFGINFGRLGFFEYLITVIVQMVAFTFNNVIVNDILQMYDIGGSASVHAFGCYFGLGVSIIISRVKRPISKIQHSYESVIFSFIGCFFLWAYWPSINSAFLPWTQYERFTVIMNTILSLCASISTAYAMSVFLRDKFSVVDIFNASLAGGIGSGAGTGLFYNPAGCLILGALSGIICVVGTEYLTGYLERNYKIFDTFAIHNVQGLPGLMGGFAGAIAMAMSGSYPQNVTEQLKYYMDRQGPDAIGRMVGFQILGTVLSFIVPLLFGMVAGKIITPCYNLDPMYFYTDSIYFQLPRADPTEAKTGKKKKGMHLKKKNTFIDEEFLTLSKKSSFQSESSRTRSNTNTGGRNSVSNSSSDDLLGSKHQSQNVMYKKLLRAPTISDRERDEDIEIFQKKQVTLGQETFQLTKTNSSGPSTNRLLKKLSDLQTERQKANQSQSIGQFSSPSPKMKKYKSLGQNSPLTPQNSNERLIWSPNVMVDDQIVEEDREVTEEQSDNISEFTKHMKNLEENYENEEEEHNSEAEGSKDHQNIFGAFDNHKKDNDLNREQLHVNNFTVNDQMHRNQEKISLGDRSIAGQQLKDENGMKELENDFEMIENTPQNERKQNQNEDSADESEKGDFTLFMDDQLRKYEEEGSQAFSFLSSSSSDKRHAQNEGENNRSDSFDYQF